jgi:hypothetical protein
MRKLLTDTDEYIYSPKILQLFRAYGYKGIGLLHMIRVRIAQHESGIDSEELKHLLRVEGELVEVWNYLIDNGFITEEFGEIIEETALDNAEIYKKKKEYDKEYQKNRREKVNYTPAYASEMI